MKKTFLLLIAFFAVAAGLVLQVSFRYRELAQAIALTF